MSRYDELTNRDVDCASLLCHNNTREINYFLSFAESMKNPAATAPKRSKHDICCSTDLENFSWKSCKQCGVWTFHVEASKLQLFRPCVGTWVQLQIKEAPFTKLATSAAQTASLRKVSWFHVTVCAVILRYNKFCRITNLFHDWTGLWWQWLIFSYVVHTLCFCITSKYYNIAAGVWREGGFGTFGTKWEQVCPHTFG